MSIYKRPQLFLIVFTVISVLFFATIATAQRPQNRMLSPQEVKDLGYDTGNPPGPYWKTERGVFELNGKDGPQPPNGPGYAGVSCDSRQDPAIYSSPTADPSKFKTWESGSCMEDGKPCCVNIDLAGYQIPPTDPRYVISDSERKICEDPDSFQGPPGMREMEMQRLKPICDALALRGNEGNAPPGGNVSGMPPIGNDAQRRFDEAVAAREQAEQKVTELETALEEAKKTLTLALDQEKAAKEALDQQSELLVAAQATLEQAQTRFTEAQTALEAAQTNQQEAQQAVDAAQAKVKELGG